MNPSHAVEMFTFLLLGPTQGRGLSRHIQRVVFSVIGLLLINMIVRYSCPCNSKLSDLIVYLFRFQFRGSCELRRYFPTKESISLPNRPQRIKIVILQTAYEYLKGCDNVIRRGSKRRVYPSVGGKSEICLGGRPVDYSARRNYRPTSESLWSRHPLLSSSLTADLFQFFCDFIRKRVDFCSYYEQKGRISIVPLHSFVYFR